MNDYMVRKWKITAIARKSGHKSIMQWFNSVEEASKKVEELYPASDWKNVSITSKLVDSRLPYYKW